MVHGPPQNVLLQTLGKFGIRSFQLLFLGPIIVMKKMFHRSTYNDTYRSEYILVLQRLLPSSVPLHRFHRNMRCPANIPCLTVRSPGRQLKGFDKSADNWTRFSTSAAVFLKPENCSMERLYSARVVHIDTGNFDTRLFCMVSTCKLSQFW